MESSLRPVAMRRGLVMGQLLTSCPGLGAYTMSKLCVLLLQPSDPGEKRSRPKPGREAFCRSSRP